MIFKVQPEGEWAHPIILNLFTTKDNFLLFYSSIWNILCAKLHIYQEILYFPIFSTNKHI